MSFHEYITILRDKKWIALIMLPFSLTILSGATCSPTTLESVEIPALEVATVNTLADDNNYDKLYCLDLIPYGASQGLKYGTASVGYHRNYDPGTEPFPCWWWVSSVDRGLVRFDLALLGAPADRITGATLEYDLTTKWDDPSKADNCSYDILASLWIMNEPWSNKFYLNAEFLTDSVPSPSCIKSHHSWNVTQVVMDWLSGVRPNHGFLFVGGDEGFPSNDNGEHKTTLSNVKLKVLIAVPGAS
jgi:hypothetical protein